MLSISKDYVAHAEHTLNNLWRMLSIHTFTFTFFLGDFEVTTEYAIFLTSANDAQHTRKNVKLTLSIR